MPRYLVFWKEQMEDALNDGTLDVDNADDEDAISNIGYRFYYAENRQKAAKMYSDDEYEYWKSEDKLFAVYEPTLPHLIELVDYNEFLEGITITDNNRKFFSDAYNKLMEYYDDNGQIRVPKMSEEKIISTVADQYDSSILPELFTEEEIKILYYDSIRLDLRVLKIDDDIADNVVTDPHKDDDKFFWEK